MRLHKLSLFSNKWKNDSKFFEDTLQVPGVKQITIRIESNSGTTTFAVDSFTASVKKADSVAAAAAALAAQAPVKKAAVKIHTPNRTILLIIVAVILLIIIVIIVRLISWFRMQSIMKNIEKDDSL